MWNTVQRTVYYFRSGFDFYIRDRNCNWFRSSYRWQRQREEDWNLELRNDIYDSSSSTSSSPHSNLLVVSINSDTVMVSTTTIPSATGITFDSSPRSTN